MAKYTKSASFGGKWVRGEDVQSGTKVQLVGEVTRSESQFKNRDGSPKIQDVGKVKFEGSNEELNISINRATLNGLIDAYGQESNDWIGKPLTAVTEKVRVGGKSVTAVYLVPDGYEKTDDENGYAIVVKEGAEEQDPF